jgi:uroporphyrinogen decarboxylase
MSLDIAMKALRLESADRPAHTEYTLHWELMERVTGLSRDDPEFERRFNDLWQIDLVWHTDDGPVPWDQRGRVTDMGHAEFLADGSDHRAAAEPPFADAGEVLAFDAVAEYGLPDFGELVTYYEGKYTRGQAERPGCVYPGGYYHTLISGAIRSFGWNLLLEAAADPAGFERVLDSFFRLSLHHYKAWAATSVEVFICHDDMVWSGGPFMHPDFYRRAIFPRYRKLWSILKEAGKTVLFCCDGQWTDFLIDAAEAGADGFIFEPMVPFETVVREFGQSHVLVGSAVDCRTLTFGTPDAIRREVGESLRLGLRCPGWICAVGNHIAPNVPVDNALCYFDHLAAGWQR